MNWILKDEERYGRERKRQDSSHRKKHGMYKCISLEVLMSRKGEKGVPVALTLGTEVEEAVNGEGKPNPSKLPFSRLSLTSGYVLELA